MGNMLGFKTRIHVNNRQRTTLNHYAAVAKHAWNFALGLCYLDLESLPRDEKWKLNRIDDYDKYFNQGKYALGEIKPTKGEPITGSGIHVWCRGVPASVSQIPIKTQLKEAWQRYFRRLGKKPVFKGRSRGNGFKLSNRDFSARSIVAERTHIDHSRLGRMRLGANIPPALMTHGKLMNTTFNETAGDWFAAFLFEVPDEVYYQISDHRERKVGIHLGMAEYATCFDQVSDEAWHEPSPNAQLQQQHDRIERLQRKKAKCLKGSSRYNKLDQQIADCRAKQSRIRLTAAHAVSRRLATGSALIVLADPALTDMSPSADNPVEGPGKQRVARPEPDRENLAMGHYYLRTQLAYKAERYGAQLALVDPHHSRHRCSACGHISPDHRQSQPQFHCEACHHTERTDVNAAKNILAAYQKNAQD